MSEIKVGQKYRYEGIEWGRVQGTLTTVTGISGERIDTDPGTWDFRDTFFSTAADLIIAGKTMGYVLAEDVEEPAEEDAVNHPSHYNSDPSGVECIEITRHRNFNIGAAIKYLWRAGLKEDSSLDNLEKEIQDLEKAIFHIKDEIKRKREE
jgi:hypothetical protein